MDICLSATITRQKTKRGSMGRTSSQAKRLDLVFGAISNETRRSILSRLREDSLTITELSRAYKMSLNAVSKHVKSLEKAGLIRRRINGREHFCQLETASFNEAMDWMSYYSEFWRDRMEFLEEHLKNRKKENS